MENDKRKSTQKTSIELRHMLSEDQKLALQQVEGFGWELQFIRQPIFQESTAVVFSGEGDKIGVLDPDGRIDMNPDIEIRD